MSIITGRLTKRILIRLSKEQKIGFENPKRQNF